MWDVFSSGYEAVFFLSSSNQFFGREVYDGELRKTPQEKKVAPHLYCSARLFFKLINILMAGL